MPNDVDTVDDAYDVPSVPGALEVDPPALSDDYYAQFLSAIATERKPSPIRGLYPLEATPGLISLLAGKPNPSTFPFTSISFSARSPTDPAHDIAITLPAPDLALSLQYSDTAGIPVLRSWLYGLQERMHGRMRAPEWALSVGSGSQDLIYKAVACMVDPGDPVLVECPMYAGVIPMFQSLHCEQIEIPTDAHGICSNLLREILEAWPAGKRRPRVLYTVPYGCNPTGMTASLERRQEVLTLARKHDFIILEDDPYYYLYYGDAPRVPSYFALERAEPATGRVLRFDSLSKILSAGMRIGFASGPLPLLRAIDMHTATSNLQASSLTQVLAAALLRAWGYAGFTAHTAQVSAFYREKRDVFERGMQKWMATEADWVRPEAGMFFWFKLRLHGKDGKEGDSAIAIRTKAMARGVLALPGTVFMPSGRTTAYVRASFSLTGEEDVERALERLAGAVRDARNISV